ncbi:MAG: DUF1972 domain-containing protein [Paramuribaculum sp.]|nr:DUF1972 domain-containing protein [Paramuribaculum sp.]
MKVSIIGTVGIPANYGGFETLVEQLVRHNNSEDLEYAVYCSDKTYKKRRWVYHGAKMEYVGLNANGLQSIPFDIISLIRAARKSDAVLVLGVSGCIFLPIFRLFSNKKLIINIDGLEHKRDKWNKYVRRFLKFSEKMAIKYGDIIISDNKGIAEYVKKEYNVGSELIAYGGDHVMVNVSESETEQVLNAYDLKKGEYSFALCRIEPENNIHAILQAFKEIPEQKLVFVGNWDRSEYGKKLFQEYGDVKNIKLLQAIYNLTTLNVLRGNCKYYIHGHSAGGTNPSLVEAMFFGKPIIAFDCVYNRATTKSKAAYFKSSDDLSKILNDTTITSSQMGQEMRAIAEKEYTWDHIAQQYESLYQKNAKSVR